MATNLKNQTADKYDRKIPLRVKMGFGVANLGDTVITEFVGAFFIFFLTNVAGIRPALAGTIIFIGVMWDAVSDPVIGTLSDRSKLKSGRRRPFLLMSVLPIVVFTTLLFTAVDVADGLKLVYFILMVILYWTSYTLFNIPYLSLGSELSTNNDEKTKASSVRQTFGTVGLLFANALPLLLVATFEGMGYVSSQAWTFSACILGVIAALAILITWRATRGWEIKEEVTETEHQPIIKNLGKVLTYKPYILIILASFIFYLAFNTTNATVIYNALVVIGAGEADVAGVYLAGTLFGIFLSVLLGWIAVKFDKKWVFVLFMAAGGVSLCIFKLTGFASITAQMIQFSLAHLGIISFLVLSYNLLYDTCEVYQFKTGQSLTGVMVSYFSFFIKLGKATALQLVGIILDVSGYNAELAVQPDTAKTAVTNMSSIIPGVLMLLCALVIVFYPITRERFRAMQEARKLRDAGQEYSTEAFSQIL